MRENVYFGVLVFLFPHFTVGIQLRCCRKPPPLIIDGKNVFEEKEGTHTLVAFVEGNNKDSRKQVKGLDLLLNNFQNMDVLDINFMAINKNNDSGFRHIRRKAKFNVYQETAESNIWNELTVGTNDFIILDHCGYMVGSSIFPNNFLLKQKGRVCTDKLIRSTYTKPPCKKHWKCVRKQWRQLEVKNPQQPAEPEVFSIVESSGGGFNSPLERT